MLTEERPVRLNVQMDVEFHRNLRRLAIDRGVSVSRLIRDLVNAEMAREQVAPEPAST